jgi:hypothetical protein
MARKSLRIICPKMRGKEVEMLFSTKTSMYKVALLEGGRYRVRRVALLAGKSSGVVGATYEGNRVELNENGHLVLYNGDEKVLETTPITNL